MYIHCEVAVHCNYYDGTNGEEVYGSFRHFLKNQFRKISFRLRNLYRVIVGISACFSSSECTAMKHRHSRIRSASGDSEGGAVASLMEAALLDSEASAPSSPLRVSTTATSALCARQRKRAKDRKRIVFILGCLVVISFVTTIAKFGKTWTILSGLFAGYFPKTAGAATAFAWSYHHTVGTKELVEPSSWLDHFSNCGGHQQSPINIEKGARVVSWLPPLSLDGYTDGMFSVRNNGRTVQMDFPSGKMIQRNATQLARIVGRAKSFNDNVYTLEQLHFHWSSSAEDNGSEHSVEGKKYPGEMHLVHFNSVYKNIWEAADKPDGLMVIAVFLEEGSGNGTASSEFTKLSSAFERLKPDGKSVPLQQSFDLRRLLKHVSLSDYFVYAGSLTTPGCFESVTWVVMEEPLRLLPSNLASLRALEDEREEGKLPRILDQRCILEIAEFSDRIFFKINNAKYCKFSCMYS